jgi:hypothetical protein
VTIENEEPRGRSYRNDFKPLEAALEAALRAAGNSWVRVLLAEIDGLNDESKRINARQCLASRGLNVTTRVEEGYLYLRVKN